MNAEQIIGKLTHDETIELAKEALNNLTLPDVIELLGSHYEEDDRAEISLSLDAITDSEVADA